jgi:hypothetical protein
MRRATAITLASIVAGGASTSVAHAQTSSAASPSAFPSPTQLKAGLAVLVTTRTVTPKIQRTVRFTGYATYTFSAPRGRRIVSASARIIGGEPHAVAIRHRTVSHNRERYTVSLIFPGEQGNPGKLLVRLGTVG